MSRIGQRFIKSGRRMTRDYPMLPPSFYNEALRAEDFFLALNLAEEKLEAHQNAPDDAPKFSYRDFRSIVALASTEKRTKPHTEVVAPQLLGENKGDAHSSLSQPAVRGNEGPPVSGVILEEEQPTTVAKTCYDCGHCQEVADDQRLVLVSVHSDGKTLNEFLGAFGPVSYVDLPQAAAASLLSRWPRRSLRRSRAQTECRSSRHATSSV
jgi:hypothetical protein